MPDAHKISVRKVQQFIVSCVLVVIFVMTLMAASRKQAGSTVGALQIDIVNRQDYSFVRVKDIEELLENNHNFQWKTATLARLNLDKMEEIVQTNPWVEKADVFVDAAMNVHVRITQRVPAARFFDRQGMTYFIDSNLKTMPVNYDVPVKVTVFTNVPEYKDPAYNRVLRQKALYLSRFFDSSGLWSNQISQVSVNNDQTFDLYTVLGNQQVVLGDTSNLALKMDNLQDFYRQVFNKIGWNKYQVLDLRFLNQIVASPSLGHVPQQAADSLGFIRPARKKSAEADFSGVNLGNNKAPVANPVSGSIAPKARDHTIKKETKTATAKGGAEVAKKEKEAGKGSKGAPVEKKPDKTKRSAADGSKAEKPATKGTTGAGLKKANKK